MWNYSLTVFLIHAWILFGCKTAARCNFIWLVFSQTFAPVKTHTCTKQKFPTEDAMDCEPLSPAFIEQLCCCFLAWVLEDFGTCRTQSSAAGKAQHEPSGTAVSQQDFILPAYGSLQTRRKLISFSEGLRQGRSLHIQLDRRTGETKCIDPDWDSLKEQIPSPPFPVASSALTSSQSSSSCYFGIINVYSPWTDMLVYTNWCWQRYLIFWVAWQAIVSTQGWATFRTEVKMYFSFEL